MRFSGNKVRFPGLTVRFSGRASDRPVDNSFAPPKCEVLGETGALQKRTATETSGGSDWFRHVLDGAS